MRDGTQVDAIARLAVQWSKPGRLEFIVNRSDYRPGIITD